MNLHEFLAEECAKVNWIVKLDWAFPFGCNLVEDLLEFLMSDSEEITKAFGVSIPFDLDPKGSPEEVVNYLASVGKNGFVAEIEVEERLAWDDSGWDRTGCYFVVFVYANSIEELEAEIKRVIETFVKKMEPHWRAA